MRTDVYKSIYTSDEEAQKSMSETFPTLLVAAGCATPDEHFVFVRLLDGN